MLTHPAALLRHVAMLLAAFIGLVTPGGAGRTQAVVGNYLGGGPVGVSGSSLTLGGTRHFFVGVDAYSAATDYGVNPGCGPEDTQAQLDAMFSGLPPDSLVRIWAFQGAFGTSVTTHAVDWDPLDNVLATAARYHQLVILVLGNQGGTCDGQVWQDPAWYSGGYRQVQDPTGQTPLSYWDYVTAAVEHFRSAPALAMWEPINEAEASTCTGGDVNGACVGGQTCPDEAAAATALRSFFTTVGERIQSLDPEHPVESGLLGGGQCGTAGGDYATVSASPGINVLSYHDYYGPALVGGDQWNGVAVRLSQARSLGKPILAGEVGINAAAQPAGNCVTFPQRAAEFAAKIAAQRSQGLSGALLWDENNDVNPPGDCSPDIAAGDPSLGVLATAEGQPAAGSPVSSSPTGTSGTGPTGTS